MMHGMYDTKKEMTDYRILHLSAVATEYILMILNQMKQQFLQVLLL